MPRGKKKKTILDKKGPFALWTVGNILKTLFMAVIVGLGLTFFNALELTLNSMLLLLILMFLGLMVGTILYNYGEKKMKE